MKFSLSIVSHGSGRLLKFLLRDLQSVLPSQSEIILTFNTAEDETFLENFKDLPIRIIRNTDVIGFGGNHNRAFAVSNGQYFVVLNPDIRLLDSPFEKLAQAFEDPRVGVTAPLVLSAQGDVEDSVRRFPTAFRLIRRLSSGTMLHDYAVDRYSAPTVVDWAAGMFLMFSRDSFCLLRGFDERFFMYMEDADIGRRLKRVGRAVMLLPSVQVVHNAQRASRKNWRHFLWHIRSAARYFTGV